MEHVRMGLSGAGVQVNGKRDALALAQMSAEDAGETAVRCRASALAFVDSPPLETMEDVEDRDEDDAVARLFRAIDVAMGVDAS